jgi:hypothetical protein
MSFTNSCWREEKGSYVVHPHPLSPEYIFSPRGSSGGSAGSGSVASYLCHGAIVSDTGEQFVNELHNVEWLDSHQPTALCHTTLRTHLVLILDPTRSVMDSALLVTEERISMIQPLWIYNLFTASQFLPPPRHPLGPSLLSPRAEASSNLSCYDGLARWLFSSA